MKKAAIYVRVSTNYQVDKDSLPLQKQDMINYAKYALNIDEYEIFEDAGFSGKNTKRPAFQKMMRKIKNGEFTHLLVWKIDRISRNLIDFCEMYEEIKKYNCTFISKNEQFDTSTAMGETMLKIILVFAELERKLTAERVTAIMFDRASKGLWNGAPMPLGYTWDKHSKFPVIDKDEALTIETIFKCYLELNSSALVRDYLNANGFKTKRGGIWRAKTVGDIIRNPFYKGTYRYNYKEGGRGKKKEESEWIIVEDNHPAIIDRDLWIKCNAIMDENCKINKSEFRPKAKTHIFSNLVKCGECGESFYGREDKPHKDGFIPSIYICSGKNNHNGCSQRTISEKTIANFIFNLIFNFSLLNKSMSLIEIEKTLLKGPYFKNVSKIDEDSLLLIKKLLAIDPQDLLYSKIESTFKKVDFNLDILKKEKEKFERALKRLDDIYLFDDDSMAEKDYLLKRNDIQDKLKKINYKLNNYSESTDTESEFKNHINKIALILELKNEPNISYKSITNNLGKKILKSLMREIILKIFIRNGQIISLEFKNGIKLNFSYKLEAL